MVFTAARMSKKSVASCEEPNLDKSLPLISVLAASTTRRIIKPLLASWHCLRTFYLLLLEQLTVDITVMNTFSATIKAILSMTRQRAWPRLTLGFSRI